MKNIHKILLLFALFIGLLSTSNLLASTSSYSTSMWVSRHGSSVSQIINIAPFGVEKQVYSVDISGNYNGHGAFGPSGGKYGISVCINSVGAMWNGSCWNVVDPNGAGNIGDSSGNIPGSTVGIGGTSNDFNYVSAEVYVNDADASVNFNMNGREVSINGFNTTSGTVVVGSQFDITWNTGEITSASQLTYSGNVTCDVANGFTTLNNTDGTTCTGASAGTATFNLRATGYGGNGTKDVYSQPINVSIVSPPVSCGNGSIEAGEQCDTAGNNGGCPRSCSNACTVNSCSVNLCGNGVINAGEQCDNGVNNGASPRACSNYCTNNAAPGNVNISLTVNGPGTVGTNLVAGRFGPGSYSGVIPVNTFVQFDVIPNPGEASSWSWGGPCSFFNSPLSSVCAGNATVDTANVVTFVPIPVTGTITPANSSCVIPAGQSGCYSPTLSWSTAGFRNGIVATVTSSTGVPASVTGNSGTSAFYVTHNPSDSANEFYLSHNGVTLATAVVNTSCAAGTVWSGGACTVLSTPVLQSVQLNSSSVTPNGSTPYTITVVGTDSSGGDKISHEYALVNFQGGNAGLYRGYVSWYYDQTYTGWNPLKDKMNCSGGGIAAIQSGYGSEYIELDSCVSTVSGTTRTTTFTVRFNSVFGVNGPTTLNDISGYVQNKDGNSDGWDNVDLNFGLNMPIATVSINPASVLANNSTQHTISVVGTDPTTGSNISELYSLTNWQGANAGVYRGALLWAAADNWPAFKDHRSCTGGGYGVVSSSYNPIYMNLVSCSTTVSGNNRTVNFVVTFDSSFITPATGNQLSAHAYNIFSHPSGWMMGDTFDLTSTLPPTVISPTVSGITSTGATLGANVTSLGVPASISARGTCWGTNPNPVTNCTAASGLTTGVFTHARTSMPSNTTIYYRGYATNTSGTGYSPDGSFTTSAGAVNGACATPPNGSSYASAPTPSCSAGTPTAISGTGPWTWSCNGSGGGTNASCQSNLLATPTLSASPASVAPGGSVTATFANISGPTNVDWIGSYLTSAANGSPEIAYIYTSSCTTAAGGTTPSSGNCTFVMPVTPGSYNLRMYPNDQYNPTLAVSNTITVAAAAQNTLNVSANPGPGGRITGTGINCGADCSENVAAGSTVTLTAVPASSYWKFTGWGGACSGTSTTCNVTVSTNPTTVSATFVPRAFIYREF